MGVVSWGMEVGMFMNYKCFDMKFSQGGQHVVGAVAIPSVTVESEGARARERGHRDTTGYEPSYALRAEGGGRDVVSAERRATPRDSREDLIGKEFQLKIFLAMKVTTQHGLY